MGRQKKKIFRDPVHGTVALPKGLLVDLVESSVFQRMRHIRQLGMCFTTFHGAEHTRFQHALGVAHLASRVLTNWSEEGYLELSPEEEQATLAAALLHDVGHGPFSHALERVFSGLSHESIGHSLILHHLDGIFARHGVDPQLVVAILQGSCPRIVLHELVSGTVDVDRMDYLLRDSLYTGVKYGLFDLERILNCLIPLQEAGGHQVLAIKRKGVEAVEEFIFSRYFMYWQVYFHGTVRAAELVMRLALERARELWWADQRPPLPPHLQFLFEASTQSGQLSLDFGGEPADPDSSQHRQFLRAFLELDDTDIFYALKLWCQSHDPILADLARRVRTRRLFKVAPHPGPEKVEAVRELMRRRYGEGQRYYWAEDIPSPHSQILPLRIETGPGTWAALSQVSRIQALGTLEEGAKAGFLLYPEECREEVEAILKA